MSEFKIQNSKFKIERRSAWPMLITFALFLLALLTGCGQGTTQEVSKKVETSHVKTKAELESLLGKPDKFEKLGPIESWTYKTSDGEYSVQVMGDKVVFSSGGTEEKKK